MSEPEDNRGEPKSEADRTLLGVAPPRFEGTAQSAPRSPVLVRAGDSVADVEPVLRPRVALPSRPPAAATSNASLSNTETTTQRVLRVARENPVVWMVAAPALAALCVIGLAVATAPTPVKAFKPAPASSPPSVAAPVTQAPAEKATPLPSLAELEAKPPGSLVASELLRLAELRRERRRLAIDALREKVAQSPALLEDKSVQAELLQAARDALTAPQALAAIAAAGTPLGADLLYEAWTGTPGRTDATELSRALLYSQDVRPKASPALSVALDLRVAETCEQYQAALPGALKQGDKRSLHLLGKLVQRRGCGPRKAADCYPCLRAENDELVATINAAKSRRPPTFPVP
ncbi:MAG: Serine/threonine-protein kinase pkn3 [Polyangiaceae bacterium]|jgi:hypothetical protein|nr:Serine/threonine-protein kinase pkn3 [Polyangiaceae bacterium]